jgi:predicted transcriptional regulator/ribosomal protein S18 acetylase RimI-like enzyme
MSQTKLFSLAPSGNSVGSYYVIKLTNEVSYPASTVLGFRDIVLESGDLYPGIDLWFDKKVIPGIKEGKRYAYLIMQEGKPIAEAVVRRGEDTKLCSMRIMPAYQNKAIGPFLFDQIALLLDNSVKHVHFTAPESLVVEREGLFERLGFSNMGRASKIYRVGEDELVFKANASTFRKRATRLHIEIQEHQLNEKLESYADQTGPIVLSIHPEFAKKIVTHKKTVEIRKRFSKKLVGSCVFLYATRPIQSVVGEARISSVAEGRPHDIWMAFKDQLGCSKTNFTEYCRGYRKIYAVSLEELIPYPDPLPWAVFSAAFDAPIRPPQSYQFLKPAGFARAQNYPMLDWSKLKRHEGTQMMLF